MVLYKILSSLLLCKGIKIHKNLTNHSLAENDPRDILNFKYPLNLAPRSHQVDTYVSSDNQTYVIPDPYRYFEESDSEATKNWLLAE